MKKDPIEKPLKDAGTAGETAVEVWFKVTQHAALIGDCHHAAGKRMKLPKPVAEECVSQGLGVLDGVVI
jgi:hypothetical protein